jgi:hypothetical protein
MANEKNDSRAETMNDYFSALIAVVKHIAKNKGAGSLFQAIQ